MTKKHFIALADALRSTQDSMDAAYREGEPLSDKDVWDMLVWRIAEVCKVNPHFNEERWTAYIRGECGPNGDKRNGG